MHTAEFESASDVTAINLAVNDSKVCVNQRTVVMYLIVVQQFTCNMRN